MPEGVTHKYSLVNGEPTRDITSHPVQRLTFKRQRTYIASEDRGS